MSEHGDVLDSLPVDPEGDASFVGGDIVTHTFFLCREKSNQDLCWGFFFFFLQLSISCISASFNIFSYITYAMRAWRGGAVFFIHLIVYHECLRF